MKIFLSFILLLAAITIHTNPSLAQLSKEEFVKNWGDSLRFHDPENRLHYDYKEDDKMLYIGIFKNEFATKAIAGGLQFSFDNKKITDQSASISLGHRFSDPDDPTKPGNREAYLQVNNIKGIPNQLLPVYNAYGISTAFGYLIDRSHIAPAVNGVVDLHKNGKNKSQYWAEITIPKIYLPNGQKELHIGFCLVGADTEKRGLAFMIQQGRYIKQHSIGAQESNDVKYYTEYFTTIKLK